MCVTNGERVCVTNGCEKSARDSPSATVMTPSLPTFSIAEAIISPISRSELAEMVATFLISSLVEIILVRAWGGGGGSMSGKRRGQRVGSGGVNGWGQRGGGQRVGVDGSGVKG